MLGEAIKAFLQNIHAGLPPLIPVLPAFLVPVALYLGDVQHLLAVDHADIKAHMRDDVGLTAEWDSVNDLEAE